jgi:phospholipid/cholesterol/gamma-HCH transport system substrate-binding protein
METRANFVLIGSFVLAGLLGGMGFILWFAQVQLDRTFAYYDIKFDSVSGLSNASDVRFSGLPVGQVVDVRLAPEGDGTIRVRIEVAADTPVREDSVATIEAQGVTGVSFVGISAGTPGSPLLGHGDGDIRDITAGRSVLQTLTQDAPQLIAEVLGVAKSMGEVLGADNQARVEAILTNLEASTNSFASALDDFSALSNSISTAATDIADFTNQLDTISQAATRTLGQADVALDAFTSLAAQAEGTLAQGDALIDSATGAFAAADAFLGKDLPTIVADLRATNDSLRGQIDSLGGQANEMLAEFGAAGAEARARLVQAEATIAAADTALARLTETLASVDRATEGVDTFVRDQATPLAQDTRAAVASATRAIDAVTLMVENDLPAILADIRAATDTANRVFTSVGADLQGASGRIEALAMTGDDTLLAITETFGRANATLAAIDQALVTGQSALVAAEGAFTGADRLISEDFGSITADLRGVVGRLDEALSAVAADLPQVTGDLRRAAESAQVAFADVGEVVTALSGPARSFASAGLPQYTLLAQETRALIASLERVARQIERDPTRFFLDRQSPEFRR